MRYRLRVHESLQLVQELVRSKSDGVMLLFPTSIKLHQRKWLQGDDTPLPGADCSSHYVLNDNFSGSPPQRF